MSEYSETISVDLLRLVDLFETNLVTISKSWSIFVSINSNLWRAVSDWLSSDKSLPSVDSSFYFKKVNLD